MTKQYKTLIVEMTGTMYYPKVTVRREKRKMESRSYGLNAHDLKRIQALLDTTNHRIYADIENSKVEVLYVKEVTE